MQSGLSYEIKIEDNKVFINLIVNNLDDNDLNIISDLINNEKKYLTRLALFYITSLIDNKLLDDYKKNKLL